MKLKTYLEYIAEKKGLQLSLFPDIVPHEEPEPESPEEEFPFEEDFFEQYLTEMLDYGWEPLTITGYLHTLKGEEDTYILTNCVNVGEQWPGYRIAFGDAKVISDEDIKPTLGFFREIMKGEHNMRVIFTDEHGNEVQMEDIEVEDNVAVDTSGGNQIDLYAIVVPFKPFVYGWEDIMKKENWDRKNFPEGYKAEREEYKQKYKMVDGTPWILIDQEDLLKYFCRGDKYESQLLHGVDDYHSHYRPDAESVFRTLDKEALRALLSKTAESLGGVGQLLAEGGGAFSNAGIQDPEKAIEELASIMGGYQYGAKKEAGYRAMNLVQEALPDVIDDLRDAYADMEADDQARQDEEAIQDAFDDIVRDFLTFKKSERRISFGYGDKRSYHFYLYWVKLDSEMIDKVNKTQQTDGYPTAEETDCALDNIGSPADLIERYIDELGESYWELSPRLSEYGSVDSKEFSKIAIDLLK